MQKVSQGINTQRDIQCSGIGRLNSAKIFILPKIIYRFNEIFVEIEMEFFNRKRKNSKIHEPKKTLKSQSCTRRKPKASHV